MHTVCMPALYLKGECSSFLSHVYYRCMAKHSKCTCSIPCRYQTSLLASLGFLISFGIRCNMGIAMIQMTDEHAINVTEGNVTKEVEEVGDHL